MEAYGIFQGGGAKGYAHVGALKAAEERGIQFIRYAGTSAGAIVAALAAAGYTADEIYDPERVAGERGILDINIDDLLDAQQYGRVRSIMEEFGNVRKIANPRDGIIGWWQRTKREQPLAFMRWVKFGIRHRASFLHVNRHFGMVEASPVTDWLDNILKAKLGTAHSPTFRDIGMKLKIVAANLRTGEVHQFGTRGDENLPIAPAVMASACFPFFFQPVSIAANMFVDGGLVSNLPVWLFDDERDDDTRHLPTFGFRLINDTLLADEKASPKSFFGFGRRIMQTLLSGARNLEERRVDYYHAIDLTARIGTLSFATLRDDAPAVVRAGRNCVDDYFDREVGPQDPARIERILDHMLNELVEHYEWRNELVRAHVLLPEPSGRFARTMYSCHMEADGDDHLRVRLDTEGAGSVFRYKEPIYLKLDELEAGPGNPLKYELAARPRSVAYQYAIPIFRKDTEWRKGNPRNRHLPFAALVIDKSNPIDLLLFDEAEQDLLANVAAIVGEEVKGQRLIRRRRMEPKGSGPPGMASPTGAAGILVSNRKTRDARDGDFGTRLGSAFSRIK